MVAITADNHLYIEEDREGATYAARIEGNFMDDARHSVYYTRHGDDASLLVDRVQILIKTVPNKPLVPVSDPGANHVQIGGVNTTDPRFAVYKSYDGCLSNIFIQVNNETMKPLEEYMLFTKSEAETITVINSQGVRSAQCKQFDVIQKLTPFNEPALNMTSIIDKNWVVDAPTRVPYKAVYFDPSTKEEKTQVVFITLTAIFVIIVVCCLIEVYRSDREYRKRIERQTDEDIIWSKEQATKMQNESSTNVKGFSYKSIPTDEKKDNGTKPLVGILKNGNVTAPSEKVQVDTPPINTETGGIRDSQLLDHELQWESLAAEENESLLKQDPSKEPRLVNGDSNGDAGPRNRIANGNHRVTDLDHPDSSAPDENEDSELTDNPVKVSFAKTTTTSLANSHSPGPRKHPPKLILTHPPEPDDGPGTPIGPLPVTMLTSTPLTNGLRSRGPRQVSWGPPPPPALISANPLPFKIDE
uniref:Laminin G domain-containing protein n=1 Tax=Anopheles maculatus TaxID=74869 RepID=A0A182S5T5_9DIPT